MLLDRDYVQNNFIILCLTKLRHYPCISSIYNAHISTQRFYAVKMSTIFGECIFIYFRIAHKSHIIGFRHRIKLLKCKTTAVFPDLENIAQLFDDNNID